MSIINSTAWLARSGLSLQIMFPIHPTSTDGSWILDRTSMLSTTLNSETGPTADTVRSMRRCLQALNQFRLANGATFSSRSEHLTGYVTFNLPTLHL
jgi:hypothetical protein